MNYEGSGVVEFDRHDIKLVGRGVRAARKYIPSYRKVKAGLWVLEHWLPSKRFNAKKRRFVEEGREDYGRAHNGFRKLTIRKVNAAIKRAERKLVSRIEDEWEEYEDDFGALLKDMKGRANKYGPQVLAAIFTLSRVSEEAS